MAAGWLRAPTFADAEQTRAAGLVHWILLCAIAVAAFGLLATPFIYPGRWPYLVYGLMLLGVVPLLASLRRGQVRGVSNALVAGLWLAGITSVIYYGGPRAPSAVALPVLIAMAGLLRGPRAAIGFGLISALLILGITVARPTELPADLNPLRYWLVLTFSILASASMVALAVRSINGALAASRASERRLAEMVQASPDGMVSLSTEGIVESVNRAALEIWGVPAGDVVGRDFMQLGAIPPENLAWAGRTALQAYRGDLEGPVETEVLRHDGTRVPIEAKMRRLVRSDGTTGLQITLRDLSERARAAREVEELEARLVHSRKLESIGQLAGGVAHDFNNYLTAIRINTELIQKHVDDRGQAAELLAGIETAAERSGALIRQLLAFGRKQILQPRVIDLNELVTNLDPMLRRLLPEDIALKTSCGSGLGRVRADPAQIETAILNLVVNGCDAMPGGGTIAIETANASLGVKATERLPEVEAGPFVMIAVSDGGVGIDEEGRKRIFEPFFSTKDEPGTGLGLSTVYGIVTQSGGTMTVESQPDQGSRFQIYLPRVEDPLDAEPVGAAEPLPERAYGTILLVEDDADVRGLALSVLRSRGYEVLSAADGLEALDLVKRENPWLDLVVTDLVMPNLGGLGLARALRETRPGVGVLFISGYAESRAGGLLDPEAEILPKPFTASDLARQVHAMLIPS